MSAPVRHPATEKAWAWLESRPEEEMEPYRRARIAVTLTELDAELIAMDLATVRMKRARARPPVEPQCETLAGEPKFAEGWADPENPDRLS